MSDWKEVEARLRDATRWTDSRGRQLENTFVIRTDLLAALARIEALEGERAKTYRLSASDRDDLGRTVLSFDGQFSVTIGTYYWIAAAPAPPSLAPKEPTDG